MLMTDRPARMPACMMMAEGVSHGAVVADRGSGRRRRPRADGGQLARCRRGAVRRAALLGLLVLLPSMAIAAPAGRTARDPERRVAASRGVADVGDGRGGGADGDRGGGAGDARADREDGDEADLAGSVLAPRGPTVGAVLAAAYAAAGLDRDPQGGWIRRARLAGLVPWVTVRTTRDTSWQDDQSEVGHGTSLELRATWRLDRLMFDGRELQVAAIEASRRRERRRLASRVIRAYFTWRRAANAAVIDDRAATRAAEAEAELDALTDGWFSDELRRPRRAAEAAGSAKSARGGGVQ